MGRPHRRRSLRTDPDLDAAERARLALGPAERRYPRVRVQREQVSRRRRGAAEGGGDSQDDQVRSEEALTRVDRWRRVERPSYIDVTIRDLGAAPRGAALFFMNSCIGARRAF